VIGWGMGGCFGCMGREWKEEGRDGGGWSAEGGGDRGGLGVC
jgi:hypothetical protein